MKRYPILEVCARVEGHTVQHQILREYCHKFQDWQGLLERAEREGMAPLARKHLIESESDFPTSVRRSLNILYKRHQKQAEVRLKVLEGILILFQQHQLIPMLIKGAALCQTLYSDPALRPMRDIDILFSRDDVDQAQELLRNVGFKQSGAAIPPDHYHLPSLYKNVGDVKVCIELHRGLYPDCPPYYPEVDFVNLLKTGRKIKIGEVEAFTFSLEETLHYLYQHGFHAPLTYEKYKLINAADIIGFTEKYFQEIDWKQVKKQCPQLCKALPLMHHISPWDFANTSDDSVSKRGRRRQLHPIPFTGWPQKRMKQVRADGSTLFRTLLDTFLPTRWWVGVYYGTTTCFGYLRCLLWRHPRHVYWWAKLYSE
jgi:hypothetical protein